MVGHLAPGTGDQAREDHPAPSLFIKPARASWENRTLSRQKALVVSISGPAAASEIPALGEQETQSWNLDAAHTLQGHPHRTRHLSPI